MRLSGGVVPRGYSPTPFYTRTIISDQSIELVRDVVTPNQIEIIEIDLSTVENIPSVYRTTRSAFLSSRRFQIGIAILITCLVAASIAIPLGIFFSNSNQSADSSNHLTTTTITTLTIRTTVTITSATTTTSDSTTSSTITSSTTTSSSSTTSTTSSTSISTSTTSTTSTISSTSITTTSTTSCTSITTSTASTSTATSTSTRTSTSATETTSTTRSTSTTSTRTSTSATETTSTTGSTSTTSTKTSTSTTRTTSTSRSTSTTSTKTSTSTTRTTSTTRSTSTTSTKTSTSTTRTTSTSRSTSTTSTSTTRSTSTTSTSTSKSTTETTSTTRSTSTTKTSTSTSTSTTKTSTSTSTSRTKTSTSTSTSTTKTTSTTRSTSTTTSTSTAITTTSLAQSSSFWPFDNTTADKTSIFNGVGVNSPTFHTPGIDGYGAALYINRLNSQYVNVSTYRNLSYVSFTVELWFYCTNLTSADYGFFGQYFAQTTDQSLHYLIRNYSLYLGFFSDDLMGSTRIRENVWYHAAFVYDYPSSTQKIYLNGKLDGSRSSSPYQGTSGAIVIGKTEQILGVPNCFFGYIDDMSLVMRSKNATEILDDATLVTWNTFDSTPYIDSGPLNLSVTAVNVTSVSGRVNQAINFNSNSSYYQLVGFVLLGVSNNSYSISLWVYPSLIRGSTLVHLSTTKNGQGWCVDLIGFSSTGQIIITGWGNSNQQIIGPILPINIWTNIVNTYSSINGYRLYINGTLIGTTTSTIYTASGSVNILTLANPIQGIQTSYGGSCNSQSIIPNVYFGSIDEFRVYSRELNTTDIYTLANP